MYISHIRITYTSNIVFLISFFLISQYLNFIVIDFICNLYALYCPSKTIFLRRGSFCEEALLYHCPRKKPSDQQVADHGHRVLQVCELRVFGDMGKYKQLVCLPFRARKMTGVPGGRIHETGEEESVSGLCGTWEMRSSHVN